MRIQIAQAIRARDRIDQCEVHAKEHAVEHRLEAFFVGAISADDWRFRLRPDSPTMAMQRFINPEA